MKRKMISWLMVIAILFNMNMAITAILEAERAEAKENPVIKAVSVNGGYSAAITEDGDLYCWGKYDLREIISDALYPSKPVKILENIADVILYHDTFSDLSVAIAENGDLYCWGDNFYGEAGNGIGEAQYIPKKILENVETFSFEYGRCAAITKNGDLYCWGSNKDGVIGNGKEEAQLYPVKVLENVKMVSLGAYHSAAITKDGELYCWGHNAAGQIGNGTTEKQPTPMKILENVENILLSGSRTLAVTEKGDLYSWGFNSDTGQIGNGTIEDYQLTPIKILENVKTISVDAAITENGDLYCWGENDCGQVGNGTTENQLSPMKVLEDVEYIYSDGYYKMAITQERDLYCWGENDCGQIGNGTTENQLMPIKVLKNVKSIFECLGYSAAITENGDLYCWGYNGNGLEGNRTAEDQLTPIKILENVKIISLGFHIFGSNVAAITNNGELYCWKDNSWGQIGNGTHEDYIDYPVNITEYFNSEQLPDISDKTPAEQPAVPTQPVESSMPSLQPSAVFNVAIGYASTDFTESVFDVTKNNVTVKGDGDYAVSYTATKSTSDIHVLGLDTNLHVDDVPQGMTMTATNLTVGSQEYTLGTCDVTNDENRNYRLGIRNPYDGAVSNRALGNTIVPVTAGDTLTIYFTVRGTGVQNPDAQTQPTPQVSAAPEASPSVAPEDSSSTAPQQSPSAGSSSTTKNDTTSQSTTSTKVKEVSKPGKVKLKSCKSKKKSKITIKWKKVSKAYGYQIQCSTKRSFAGKKVYFADGKSASWNVKSKKTYYVRIRAYKMGNIKYRVFGKWSKVKKVKVK